MGVCRHGALSPKEKTMVLRPSFMFILTLVVLLLHITLNASHAGSPAKGIVRFFNNNAGASSKPCPVVNDDLRNTTVYDVSDTRNPARIIQQAGLTGGETLVVRLGDVPLLCDHFQQIVILSGDNMYNSYASCVYTGTIKQVVELY
jgi:hypothetical protein